VNVFLGSIRFGEVLLMSTLIRVIAVRPLPDYRLELDFSNGETRLFDARPYLTRGIFTELQDVSYFGAVRVAFGGVVWPNEQDFGPDSLYCESQPIDCVADAKINPG